ncbi:hypothetical protein HYDPIDRAFT_23968 [Hydnomerulius pinastri MD-312]|nr:hypothetical protein HYDPIDRAFT_23968 [Hydnomerulius pinastri MD-312]
MSEPNQESYTLQTTPSKVIQGHEGVIYSVAFFPDGKRIASGSADLSIRIWDLESGQQVGKALEGHTADINTIAISPDGTRIASGSDDSTIQLWDPESTQSLMTITEGQGDNVSSVAFSPDGKLLASGFIRGTVTVWNTQTSQKVIGPLQHGDFVYAVAFSYDGSKVAGGSYADTRIWDATTGGQVHQIRKVGWSLAFTMGGRYLLIADDEKLSVVDARTWGPLATLEGHDKRIQCVAASPSGPLVATASEDNTVRVWDLASREFLGTPLEHPGEVRTVAFSPNGRKLITAGDDALLRIYDIESSLSQNAVIPEEEEPSEAESSIFDMPAMPTHVEEEIPRAPREPMFGGRTNDSFLDLPEDNETPPPEQKNESKSDESEKDNKRRSLPGPLKHLSRRGSDEGREQGPRKKWWNWKRDRKPKPSSKDEPELVAEKVAAGKMDDRVVGGEEAVARENPEEEDESESERSHADAQVDAGQADDDDDDSDDDSDHSLKGVPLCLGIFCFCSCIKNGRLRKPPSG